MHVPPCPPATGSDREAARILQRDEALGWALLCNGLLVFDTAAAQVLQGCVVRSRRTTPTPCSAA
ncbi:DUF5999 family protein [Streptomyces sp. V1I6]|uniref:DUF5999 family protein n=1 Tax=Streptomyces sp. V1I6 TaxID=3042273 RepID=UPI0027D7BB95|nr:DUF5999 family protein [Streptomyces sp. V1I6]